MSAGLRAAIMAVREFPPETNIQQNFNVITNSFLLAVLLCGLNLFDYVIHVMAQTLIALSLLLFVLVVVLAHVLLALILLVLVLVLAVALSHLLVPSVLLLLLLVLQSYVSLLSVKLALVPLM